MKNFKLWQKNNNLIGSQVHIFFSDLSEAVFCKHISTEKKFEKFKRGVRKKLARKKKEKLYEVRKNKRRRLRNFARKAEMLLVKSLAFFLDC